MKILNYDNEDFIKTTVDKNGHDEHKMLIKMNIQ